jgi:hypothetical protein
MSEVLEVAAGERGREAEACADCSKREIQPSGKVANWNIKRWDICSDSLHRSSSISLCKIHRVDAGAVELKSGPHTTLGSWWPVLPISLTPTKKQPNSIDYTTTVCTRGEPSGKFFFALHNPSYLINWWSIQKCLTQNYQGFGLFPSSDILGIRKYDISETGSVSFLRWSGEDAYSVGFLKQS